MAVLTGGWLAFGPAFIMRLPDDIWQSGGMDRTEIRRHGYTISIPLSHVWASYEMPSCTENLQTTVPLRRTKMRWPI